MRRRPRQLSLRECYAILKLEKNVDLQAVKRAYRRRAFELHPDLNPGNPEASHQFQLLNEAYVALSAVLKPAEEARQRQEAHKAAQAESRKNESSHTGQRRESGASTQEEQTSQGHTSTTDEAEQKKSGHAYAEHDVLRDLLNDPFARRVFEDIYSELSRQQDEPAGQKPPRSEAEAAQTAKPTQARQSGQTPHPPPRQEQDRETKKRTPQQSAAAWASSKWNNETGKGVKGAVKGWLRRQIDEEQRLVLPAAGLVPGRRVRLQIRKALSGELVTVEITLPPDFVIGKPIRLRGLGKKVGPWQGDLYLTIVSQ
ncbi:MAG: DnaJ domain-containing protein [Desulfovibrio sp.]|nr:DnaJ domain-containing protein [Desulfovibrio sp.]